MSIKDLISRDWMEEAEARYQSVRRDMEGDVGECLQPCCARDLRDQVYTSRVTSRLKALDVTSREAVYRADVLPQAAIDGAARDSGVLDSEESELSRLRERRASELRRAAAEGAAARLEGYGSLLDVSMAQALELLQCEAAVVLHLFEPGIADETDEELALLAREAPGTRFVRAPARACPHILRRIGRSAGAWLVAARRGEVVGVTAAAPPEATEQSPGRGGAEHVGDELSDFGSGSDAGDMAPARAVDWAAHLREWTSGHGVLRMHRAGPEREGDAGGAAAKGATGDWDEPCALCGRTYHHIHKRSVRHGGVADERESW